jgi:hypothetical protein
MSDNFLSLKEAETYTGKSRSTLRRFVESITKPENHPDRKFIEPNIKRVTELHAGNHPFSWRVSTDLLDREYRKQGSQTETKSQPDSSSVPQAMIEVLQESLSILKTELDEKNKQISQFQERQRETNILLQQTTEKLMLLTDGNKHRVLSNEDAITVDQNDEKKGSRGSTTSNKKKPKTLWQRLQTKLF